MPYQSNHATKPLQSSDFLTIQQVSSYQKNEKITPNGTSQLDISAMLDNGIITMREGHPTDEHFNALAASGKLAARIRSPEMYTLGGGHDKPDEKPAQAPLNGGVLDESNIVVNTPRSKHPQTFNLVLPTRNQPSK